MILNYLTFNAKKTYAFLWLVVIFFCSWIWTKCDYEYGPSYAGKWRKISFQLHSKEANGNEIG